MAETTPITPVEMYTAQQPFGDASIERRDEPAAPPTAIERYLRSPWKFWLSEAVLFTPVALFLLQGLLHELGRTELASKISAFLFPGGHTIVGDTFGPLVLPAVGILLALARIRDARPGADRKGTIWLTWAGVGAIGIVLGYALLENFGRFFR
jgi:hypothetical protein